MMSMRTFGVLGLADSEIAFDVGFLREVVPLTGPLAPLPRAPNWLAGSFTLRGVQIPTVDTAALLGFKRESAGISATPSVAVFGHRGGRFGLLIDRVSDVLTVAEDRLNRLDGVADTATPFVTESFARPEGDTPIYVLDLEALFTLDGMTLVSDEAGHGARTARTGVYARAASRRRAVIASAQDLVLAIDADVVREIADRGELIEPAVDVAGYLGNQGLRSDTVPVFDTRVLLGRAAAGAGLDQLVVLDTGHGSLALAVDRIVSMVDYQADDCLPLAGLPGQAMAHVAGLLCVGDAPDALLLEHVSLFAREELGNLVRVHAELNADMQARQRGDSAWRRFAFLHFQASGEFVVVLDQLEAVLPMPARHMPLAADSVFEGVFRHQDHVVSLVDLRALLGRGRADTRACQVLVVAVSTGRVGFIVDSVQDIEYIEAPGDSLYVHRRGSNNPQPTLAERHHCLVSVGVGERKQFLAVLCLQALAQELLGGSAALPDDTICTSAVTHSQSGAASA